MTKLHQDTPSMAQLMRVLKPVNTRDFMELCAEYRREISYEFENGAEDYEISRLATKTGNPVVFTNYSV